MSEYPEWGNVSLSDCSVTEILAEVGRRIDADPSTERRLLDNHTVTESTIAQCKFWWSIYKETHGVSGARGVPSTGR